MKKLIIFFLVLCWGIHQLSAQNQITASEYWFDNNYDGKITQSIAIPQESYTFNPDDGINPPAGYGLHVFHYRCVDNNGLWSSTISQFFFNKDNTTNLSTNMITAIEYWFDNDYANKVQQDANMQNEYQLTASINPPSGYGLHVFHYRCKDNVGIWSSTISQFFFYNGNNTDLTTNKLTTIEYWFDNDYSNKFQQDAGMQNEYQLNASINPPSGYGLHVFHYRCKDNAGLWSPTISQFFFNKDYTEDISTNKLTTIEYWFDNDYANKVQQDASMQNEYQLNADINPPSGFGLHVFHYRCKDNVGIWSSTISQFFFYKDNTTDLTHNKITAYEYWFNKDIDHRFVQDYDNKIHQNVSPQVEFSLESIIDASSFAQGTHPILNYRCKDNAGIWSSVISVEFEQIAFTCQPPTEQPPDISLSLDNTTVSGSFTASASADHYLIVRNTTGTEPSAPVYRTRYSGTDQLPGSTFIAYQTETSISDATLDWNTPYYYYIYAANDNCIGGPSYLTASPLQASVITDCAPPAAPPSDLVLTPFHNTINISFTASASADHYLIVRNTTGVVPQPPVNGTPYSTEIQLTGSDFVSYQTTTQYTDINLEWDKTYYYYIYAANSNCINGKPIYLAQQLSGNQTTVIITPSVQASAINFTTICSTHLDISWTNGDGYARVVFVKQGNIENISIADYTNYSANSAFGSGIQTGNGWYCVYNGTGSSVTITSLTAFTEYTARIIEYNGDAGNEMYLTSTATDNPKTQTIQTSNPIITSFTPAAGPVGTLVTITGNNLSNTSSLTIGGTAAIAISKTGTTLVGMVMPGTATGGISITNTCATTNSGTNFTITTTTYPSQQQGNKLERTDFPGVDTSQGLSVAVSADGNTAIVGGRAVWVYVRNNTGSWLPQGNSIFGEPTGNIFQDYKVALSADGNTAIVGNSADEHFMGAAWIFTRNSTGLWSPQGGKLVGSGAAYTLKNGCYQGVSVSISADGNTAIVGGEADNNFQGAAWIYTRSGGTWTQLGYKLVGTGSIGDPAQGSSVSLSADGNTAIVGGLGDNNTVGAAWVFKYNGISWVQQGKLVGSDVSGAAWQGKSVSLSADGNTAIVGGPNDANESGGAFWIYKRSGETWTQQGSKLFGSTTSHLTSQGTSVSLSADGKTAIIGGSLDDNFIGAAWMFKYNGTLWEQQGNKLVGTGSANGNVSQGMSVCISADGSTAIVGGPAENNGIGAAWVYVAAPTLVVNPVEPPDFGFIACPNSSNSPTIFTLTGSNLMGGSGNINIAAPTGFMVSSTNYNNSVYTSSIDIPYSDNVLVASHFYVKFVPPLDNQDYDGNLSITGGGVSSPVVVHLSGTSKPPRGIYKRLEVHAMLQGCYDFYDNNDLMYQAQDVDNDNNSFNKWSNIIVDTLTVQIRSTTEPDYVIEHEYPTSLISTDGTITLSGSLPTSIKGYHYIVLKHWKSVETWSDSTNFTNSTINYNFYTRAPSIEFPNNMTNNVSGNPANGLLIWAGDITDGSGGVGVQDGYVTLDDMFMVYDANLIVLSGYEVLDINGDGYVTLDDMFLVYDNNLVVAQVVNPFTLNSKKK